MSTVTISDRTTTEILEDVEKDFRKNFWRMANQVMLRLIGMDVTEAQGRGTGGSMKPRVMDISKQQVGYQWEVPHLHTPMGNGIHAAAESEALRSGQYKAARSKATTKFLQGSFSVSEQVIAATRSPEFALAKEIVQNGRGAIRESHWNVNRMLVGNGSGVLGYVNGAVSADTTVTVQTNTSATNEVPPTQHLRAGDQLSIGTAAEFAAGTAVSATVDSVTADTTFETTANVTLVDEDIIIRADAYDTGASAYTEMTSINDLIALTGTVQNVNKANAAWFQSHVPSAVGALALTDIDDLLLQVRRYADRPDALFIVSNSKQWARYSALLTGTKYVNTDKYEGQLAGGAEGLQVYSPDGGIPFWIDDMVPDGVVYVFDPNAFVYGEMRPWGFLQDALSRDGFAGQRKNGYLEYEFAYAMFGELAQTNAKACGKLTGITS